MDPIGSFFILSWSPPGSHFHGCFAGPVARAGRVQIAAAAHNSRTVTLRLAADRMIRARVFMV